MNVFSEEQITEFLNALQTIKSLPVDSSFWEKEKADFEKSSVINKKRNEDLTMSLEKYKQRFTI